MSSSGPNSPGTLADDSSVGSFAWTNPGNAAASDNVYATVASSGSRVSHYLKCTNFGFSVPSGATINGIVVEVEKKRGSGSPSTVDNSVMLVKGGTISSTDKADTSTGWPASDAYSTYGSSSDLWGLTLTDTDVNASTFGVAFSGHLIGAGKANSMSVDHIRITVYYTEALTALPRILGMSQAVKRASFY